MQENNMQSDSGERRQTKSQNLGGPPPEHENLPCPRCDSTNTKFCYYNNYNLSQPRHFCKSCRRYWTQGGTLRNIPVGGSSRKNNKRSRTTTSSSSSHDPILATPISVSLKTESDTPQLLRSDINLNNVNVSGFGSGSGSGSGPGSFTSLLNTQSPGFLALGGFGLGIGSGYEDMGFEMGRGVWPLTEVGEAGGTVGDCSTWQLGNGGDGGFGDGDCFAWPELAISTPRKGIK